MNWWFPELLPAGFFLLSFAIAANRFLHMFQLSGYRAGPYHRWMKEQRKPLCSILLLLVAAAAFGFWPGTGRFIACALFLLAALLTIQRRRVKKKLVMTARAWRIYITAFKIALFWCLATVVINYLRFRMPETILFPQWLEILLLSVGLAAAPWMLIAANWFLTPIQKAINNYYIRDAQKILASRSDLIVVGITGSFGKTSAKNMLHSFLSTTYNTLMTPASYNTPMGIVRTVREQLKPLHDVFIAEMGARRKGDIAELCAVANPKHGLVTAVGPAHLETFGSIATVGHTKFELLRSIPSGGFTFCNWNDANVRKQTEIDGLNPIRCAVEYEGDYVSSDVQTGLDGSSFVFSTPEGESQRIRSPLIGIHNVNNMTCAMAVAHKMGVPLDRLAHAALTLKPVPHRMELRKQGTMTVIDDAFNSNPSGAKAALDTLSMIDGYKILVTPGMVELGDEQDEHNRTFGRQAAAVCDAVILVGEKQTVPIGEGLREKGYANIHIVPDIYTAFQVLEKLDSGGKPKVTLLENDLPDNY
jgi:UDP-N-acetylmuramoyl-tripeptide--D-alanyl-D-alanine ligase